MPNLPRKDVLDRARAVLDAKGKRQPDVADADDGDEEVLVLCSGLGEQKFIDWMEEQERLKPFKAMKAGSSLVLVELRGGRRGYVVDWIHNTLLRAAVSAVQRYPYFCGNPSKPRMMLVADLSIMPRSVRHTCLTQAIIEVAVSRSLPQLLSCGDSFLDSIAPCSENGVCPRKCNGTALQEFVALKFYDLQQQQQQPMVAVIMSKTLQKRAISFGSAPLNMISVQALRKAGVTTISGVGFGGPECNAAGIADYQLPIAAIRIDLYDVQINSFGVIGYPNQV